MPASDIAIVAVSWNTIDCLPLALDTVAAACGGRSWEAIVVDNGSTDGSVEALAARPDCELVALGENLGFTRAANLGARRADARYLLFLNPDVVLPPGSVETLAGVLDEDPAAWAATPWFRNLDGTPQHFWRRRPTAWSAALCFTHRGRKVDRIFGARALRRHQYRDLPDPPPTMPIETVGAACLLVRSEEFWDAGGFDERYFNFFQDTDLARRMDARGRHLLGVGSIEVTHQLGTTFRRLRPAETHGQLLYALRQYLHDDRWVRRAAGEASVRLETFGGGPERAHLRSVALARLRAPG